LPFSAFKLRTSDGCEYAVREPYGGFVGPGYVLVVDDVGALARVDPLHVVALCNLVVHPTGRGSSV
jgi:hypothetical protein